MPTADNGDQDSIAWNTFRYTKTCSHD